VSKTADAASPPTQATGGSARLVAAGILASRIAGLVRDAVFASYFATSAFADVFRLALRMPNVLQNLLGEGTLSASFIPVYARLLEQDRKQEAGRFAGAMFSLLLAVAGVLTLIGVALAPVLVGVFAPGFTGPKHDLAVTCTRIIFPMTGVLVLSAWALGILNSHRQFFIPYFAPVLWNAAIIATLLLFGSKVTAEQLTITAAWGALVGGGLQFLVQLPWVLRLERSLRIRWDTKSQDVRTAVRNAGPAIMGRGVVQLSGWLDLFIASFLPGAIAVLSYAQTLYLLPISLFGMSVAAAELPELSRQGGADAEVLAKRLSSGLQRIAFLVVPSAIGYLVLGDVIVAALYQRGSFTRTETIIVAATLGAYSVGLIAATATRLLSSAFFALHDTKTPARIAVLRVLVAGTIGGAATLLIRWQRPDLIRYGAIALAAATGVAAWMEWFLLRTRLARRLGHVPAGRKQVIRMIVAATIAAVVSRVIYVMLPPWPPVVQAALVLAPFGLGYFALSHALGLEVPALSRMLRVVKNR